jgi:hypothetical protein
MTRLDSQSPVLLAALALRLFGVATLGYAVPLAWHHFPHPLLSAAVALFLAVEAVLTATWWWRGRAIAPAALPVEVATGVVGMLACAGFAIHHGPAGWTGYAYQYCTLMGMLLGYAARTAAGALWAGAIWGATALVASVAIEHQPWVAAWPAVPTFLVTPLIGWITARMLRRGLAELDAARLRAMRQAAELSTERERTRHAQALHDRVLQTLETLVRASAVADPVVAVRLVDDAAWLRRFVECGDAEQTEDLAAALEAAARAATRPGVDVQVNDAGLRLGGAPRLTPPVREALLASLHQTLRAMAGAASLVVRGERDRGGVLVTVLARDDTVIADADDLGKAGARLHQVGGVLRQEPFPYAELWVPSVHSG